MPDKLFKQLFKRFSSKTKDKNEYILHYYRKLDKKTLAWMKENDIPLDKRITWGELRKICKDPVLRMFIDGIDGFD